MADLTGPPRAPQFECGGVAIDALSPAQAVEALLGDGSRQGRAVHLCNAYTLSLAAWDARYRRLLNGGHLNLPDGTPLVWVAQRLGLELPKRVYGPTLMEDTLASGVDRGTKHFLYGSTPEVSAALEAEIRRRHPRVRIVGRISPPFRALTADEEREILTEIATAQPDIVWVGTGTPRQDRFASRAAQEVPSTFVAVGAAFDFIAGARRQAPAWMQERGLEWLFRLLSEPRRLWKRYLFGNLRFLASLVVRRPRLVERTDRPSRTVVIVYRALFHYRVEFYERLRERLAEEGVRLRLLVGRPGEEQRAKRDTAELPWAEPFDTRALAVGAKELVWQPIGRRTRQADLIIVEQASRLLVNYHLLARQRLGGPLVAFWGHGVNLQPGASRIGEAVKRLTLRAPHWWFAYTSSTADILVRGGVVPSRISVTNNAIDTVGLARAYDRLTAEDLAEVRAELGTSSQHIGIFVGSLYEEKRLAFLVEAGELVRRTVPDFELVVVGDGPQRGWLEDRASETEWIHLRPATTGPDRVRWFGVAQLTLMPGLVGLVALDAIATTTPLVTTAFGHHSPEIDYVIDGVNGRVVAPADDPSAYARVVSELLTDGEALGQLVDGCRRTRGAATVEAMVERFTEGIVRALDG